MAKHSTVVVANRLPVKVIKRDGKIDIIQSDGGLPTALASLDQNKRVWIGWPGIDSDQLTDQDKKQIVAKLAETNCVPVFLSKQEVALFYEGYSNDTLWPLCHYFPSYIVSRDDYWKAYNTVNKKFCEAVKKYAEDNAKIWIHDYHLMILPAMVREKLPGVLIGYFHHIPFPSFEVFRLLPERVEILKGLLGADLVGFQIYDYARHFLSSCLRLLNIPNHYGTLHVDGRIVRADSFPIGIDYSRFEDIANSPESQEQYESLRETYYDQKIIFSVDRLDYSKGIPERLEGYRRFLEDNPQYAGQVVMLMVVSPSRTGVEMYQKLQLQIEQTVSRINGEYGSSEWMPIVYQSQILTIEELVPMSMVADTMLVTPRRDGMNLVAKEFVAAKGDKPGVLILSELAGAAEELPEALAVNPNDTHAIARAIKQSFTMSNKEKLQRLSAMQQRLRDNQVSDWMDNYLNSLNKVKQLQNEAKVTEINGRNKTRVIEEFTKAKNRLLVLDYDGTIQNFKSTPAPWAAKPSESLKKLLVKLDAKKDTTVVIQSGRTKESLEAWFGDTNLGLIAEHGVWVKRDKKWHQKDVEFDDAKEATRTILEDYTSRTPGSRIEKKDSAIVWHYRDVPTELANVRAYNLMHELRAALADIDSSPHHGNMIIEIKPDSVDKGVAVHSLVDSHNADFVLIAGDDYTDEDMFKSAPHSAVTIKVGPGDTVARYRVSSVEAMRKFLENIATPL